MNSGYQQWIPEVLLPSPRTEFENQFVRHFYVKYERFKHYK
jgi:hypothetical protein